ncbi:MULTISPECIES: hypothetical protein [unclassified Arthrobacter]|uniref:hypothetical protein n=1 Tax=unclassified Arthrobacter TaxID=235627 RepID=UPI00159D4BC0|nr:MULTISPECIES: hypothetical protein [unclassified Arthrobacter]MCQ9165419.1 hypothetical protein [Arthrobacter sp. STN4]NVM98638.1 hypothetical protein [Arthrobacter sp. SDTb3-6]
MFARVSSYHPGPGSTGEPSADTVNQFLDMPGCKGFYYLVGKDGTSLSITLWEDENAMAVSQQDSERIRSVTSAQQHMEILGVDGYEVLTSRLRD